MSCSFKECAAKNELVEKVRCLWEARVDVVASSSVNSDSAVVDAALDRYTAALDDVVGFFVLEFSGVDDA